MTMKKSLFASAIVAFTMAVSLSMGGCYYDNAESLYPTTDTIDTAVSYAYNVNIKSIIDANCASAGCHVNGTGRQAMTTYAEVVNTINNFSMKARIENGSMPPGGSMSASHTNALITWINNNYPEN